MRPNIPLVCIAFAALWFLPSGQLQASGPYHTTSADSLAFASSNLPIIVIDTHGQAIPDEPKIPADMGIIDNGPGVRNTLGDPFNGYNGHIGIEIRGSSSQMFPKLQFAVETRDAQGNNLDVSLLGLPAENDWILSAEYNDKSLMRNTLLFSLANKTGRYASRARYCELVLNNDYRGVYMVFEKIKRTKNRVNITKMTAADTSGDALTGGYIVKVDKTEGASTDGWYSSYRPYPGAWQTIYYQYDYPKPEDLTFSQRAYIVSFISSFESAMASGGFADTLTGYPAIIDVESFVDMVLLGELSKNVDAYRLSFFMHKDRDSKGGKLVAGPVWDYNLAFGNADYYDASVIPGFQLLYLTTNSSFISNDNFQVPFWWKKIFADPKFQTRLKERWQQLRAGPFSTAGINAFIDSVASLIDEGQDRNFKRWPILGTYVWPNFFVGNTYQEEVAYLKQWIVSRVAWLDGEWKTNDVGEAGGSAAVAQGYRLYQNYPNPFNPSTTIRFDLERGGIVSMRIVDVLGRSVSSLVNEFRPAGRHEVEFNARDLPSGTYFCRFEFLDRERGGDFRSVERLLLLR